jgi:hypothetical protein
MADDKQAPEANDDTSMDGTSTDDTSTDDTSTDDTSTDDSSTDDSSTDDSSTDDSSADDSSTDDSSADESSTDDSSTEAAAGPRRWILLGVVLLAVGLVGGGRLLGFAVGDDETGGCGGDTEPDPLGSQAQALSDANCPPGGSLYGAEVGGFCCMGGTVVGGTCSGGSVCALDPTQSQGNPACACLVDDGQGGLDQGLLYAESSGGFCCINGNLNTEGTSCDGANKSICALDDSHHQGYPQCHCPEGTSAFGTDKAYCCAGTVTAGGSTCDGGAGHVCAKDPLSPLFPACVGCPEGMTRYGGQFCCDGVVSNGQCTPRAQRVCALDPSNTSGNPLCYPCPDGSTAYGPNNEFCCDGQLNAAGDNCLPHASNVCSRKVNDHHNNALCGCPAGATPYGAAFQGGNEYCCFGSVDGSGQCQSTELQKYCTRDPSKVAGWLPLCNECPTGMDPYGGQYCCGGAIAPGGQTCRATGPVACARNPADAATWSLPLCQTCPDGYSKYGPPEWDYCCRGLLSDDHMSCLSGDLCSIGNDPNVATCRSCPVGTELYANDYCCDGEVLNNAGCQPWPARVCALHEGNTQGNELCSTTQCPQGWTHYGDAGGTFCCKGNCPKGAPKSDFQTICALDSDLTHGYPVCTFCPDGWSRYGDEVGGFCCVGAVSDDGKSCKSFETSICTLKTANTPAYRLCMTCPDNTDCSVCPAGMTMYGSGAYCCAGSTDGNTCIGHETNPATVVPPVCALDPAQNQGNRMCNHCPEGQTRYGDWSGGYCCPGAVSANGNNCTVSGITKLTPGTSSLPLQRECPAGMTRYGGDPQSQFCCDGTVTGNATCDSGVVCALNPAASQGARVCAECPIGWVRYADQAGGFCCSGETDGYNTCVSGKACALSSLASEQGGATPCALACGYDPANTVGRPVCTPPPIGLDGHGPVDSDMCRENATSGNDVDFDWGTDCAEPAFGNICSSLASGDLWKGREETNQSVDHLSLFGGCSTLMSSIPLNLDIPWLAGDCINEMLRGLICQIPDQIEALSMSMNGCELPVLSSQELEFPCNGLPGAILQKTCGLALSIIQDVPAFAACLPRVFAADNAFGQGPGGSFVIPAAACYELGSLANTVVTKLGMKGLGKLKDKARGKRDVNKPVFRNGKEVPVMDGDGYQIFASACYKTPLKTRDLVRCALAKYMKIRFLVKVGAQTATVASEASMMEERFRAAGCPGF